MKPRFSVIIPTLNEEKFIGNLLESLANQTHRDFEVIVVDGRSKDKTAHVIDMYRQKLHHMRMLVSQKRNTAAQRNLGAQAARSDWLVFVDADTILLPYFFERVKLFITQYHPSFVTTWCRSDSEYRGDALLSLFSNITIELSVTMHRPLAPGPLTIVRRQAHEEVGGYDEEYHNTEDVVYGRHLTDKGYPLHILRETLYVWSLRRFRREGTLAILRRFSVTALLVMLTKKPQKSISGYDLGGAIYSLKKSSRLLLLRTYETRLRKLFKELIT